MKIFKTIINILFFAFVSFNSLSDEIQIESTNLDVINNGNLVLADNVEIIIPSENIFIKSKKLKYNKVQKNLIFINEVILKDKKNKLDLKSNFLKYERDDGLIYSSGKTKLNIKNKYNIDSNNIYYAKNLNKIHSEEETLIEDNENNFYILKNGFELNLINETIIAKKTIVLDKNNNKYIFKDLFIDLKNNQIAGKELKVEFEKSYFGNKDNEPILKGRSSYSDKDELKVYKSVFSTCNIEEKDCRGWEINTDEFRHDKNKKIFEYKNSWLKIFDYKILYMPYFNHPDPSIKRKSGFLTPSYSTSETQGFSVDIPYFKVLGTDKDITFKPSYYADKSFLLQNEYRQALNSSKIISDFSFLFGDAGSKGHFYYNQFGELGDNLDFELNLQRVKGDNYLKNHNLIDKSSLIINNNLLISNLDLNWDFEVSKLSTSIKVFEDLSKGYSDRYQYVLPDFSFSRNIPIPTSYNGNFSFNSYGYNKYYETNIAEAVIINDFLFSSNQFTSKRGFATKYNIFLKNPTSYSQNSSNFEENANYDLFGTFKIDTSLPLQKKMDDYINYFIPIASFRFSPNGNKDISSKDVYLNYDNVFSLNRIGTTNQIEGGDALTLGLEFKRNDLNGKEIIDFKIANVIKSKENHKLPTKSKLNKTRSDIFGSIYYNLSENLKFGYDYSYNRDLKYSNLEGLNLDININNIFTNFYYYTTDNELGNNENISNETIINIDEENKFKFNTTKDLINNFTEFYNFIYSHETDCISLNLEYNKSFYKDGNLEPNESISFLIKLIPFTELGVNNLGSLVKN